MRVISQKGLGYKDISYESSYFYVSECAILANSNGAILEMAKYSSFEKAERAMEMLREEYLKHDRCHYAFQQNKPYPGIQNGGYQMGAMSSCIPTCELAMNVGFIPPKTFRFPQEDEIE